MRSLFLLKDALVLGVLIVVASFSGCDSEATTTDHRVMVPILPESSKELLADVENVETTQQQQYRYVVNNHTAPVPAPFIVRRPPTAARSIVAEDDDDDSDEDDDSEDDGEEDDTSLLETDWWKNDYTVEQMWDILNCWDYLEDEDRWDWAQPDSWARLRQAYNDGSADDGGFFVPVSVGKSPGKGLGGMGLGVFAEANIPEGTKIHTQSAASFSSAQDYRKFLGSLESPPMACDILHWSFIGAAPRNNTSSAIVQQQETARIQVHLDPFSCINMAAGDRELNVGCPPGSDSCDTNTYALRNIRKGGELLVKHYGDDYSNEGWRWFGLLPAQAQ
ncbi:expressed unknown protein [Seminavis robusta]|uniref:SET domain-containing protein n=1 Tax=Seminavis robusta TaxID=568900 RepID=A0A9N8DLF5_9STRA|nr:expressed unknown protein [Seminavis robusta]|eukprot:Sro207_g086780.1 n/a (334) ;mRNA; r:22674-23675